MRWLLHGYNVDLKDGKEIDGCHVKFRLSPTSTAGEKDVRRILIFEELKAAIDLLYKEHEEDDKHMYR